MWLHSLRNTTTRTRTPIMMMMNTKSSNMLMRLYSSGSISTSMKMTPEEKMILEKLSKALQPKSIRVQDMSGGCGTMFAINVTSSQFNGLTTIKQHKLVNEILKDDIPRWHGLQLQTKKDK
ncbi:Bol3p NDAI_0H01970 [Naumovozyma dairenensis CBS 421]|uniref:Uncharacterized protein n=1 Tax=Naumovozyma dairenensis (strain ATCC 10597 / BCRC 20456 / CBS 421 / NBRC 0211 / NRRL Y-12639) TaxID=1071378 RepID=G0WF10_NAUDC|nr:hypothetical protein NDAI_0H01970 [Naumovozyma dairenensis CBS 421]CCD26371.1 hypothetical protein NDAI_0H01970 [Naumovozyma dairenensis CBS 421]